VEFRILGPLEVRDGERVLPLGGSGRRATLALLLLEANRVVSAERLIDNVWGDAPPSSAHGSLQNHVWRLRRVLGDRLETRAPGYLLRIEPGELDLERFRRLVGEAQAADPEVAAETLRRALALWRGPVLADLADEPVVASAAHLDELRVAALEDRVDADLAVGRHAVLVPELDALVAEYPFRERLRRQLILALYRSGRQGDAQEAYAAARRAFVDELGTEPGEALQELHRAVLQQAPELAAHEAVAQADPAPILLRESRKWVTVLVAGLGAPGDTLDAEARRELLRARWDDCSATVERYGGVAERMGSDRLLGVFGAPAAHDDDGMRAVEAAFALRTAGLSAALATGEVIAESTGAGQALVSGAVVEEANRLYGRAGPVEVLATDRTWKLVMHATVATAIEGARRLDSFDPAAPALPRRLDTPFVGRRHELTELERAFDAVDRERRVRLITIFGAPGIGKTRLATELADRRRDAATVLAARCAPEYGDATYAPLRDIVGAIAGAEPATGLRELLAGEPEGTLVAARVAAAVGAGAEPGPVEETAWATRRLVETLARDEPVLLVLEDVHWASPAFLDLVEQLVELARGPILILCLARPELLDLRPGWGGGKMNSSSLLLEALSDRESEALLAGLAPPSTETAGRERILAAAEGNPLFIEQLLAARLEGQAESIPDSIHGLLVARIDRLEPAERAVAEVAAICGIEFSAESVAELMGADALPHLTSLARRQLVQPAEEQAFDEEAWTFRHALIREAAYEGVPKRRRAALHEAFARRIVRLAEAKDTQWDEFAGYHLEQSVRYRLELGEDGASVRGLAAEAGQRLSSAGLRAYETNDMTASASILARAVTLLPASSEDHDVALLRLSAALGWIGEYGASARVLQRARSQAERRGDERLLARVRIAEADGELWRGPAPVAEALLAETDALIPVLERAGDDEGLAEAHIIRFHALTRSNREGGPPSLQRGLEHARRAGSVHVEGQILNWFCVTLPRGTMPTGAAADWCLELLESAPNRLVRAGALGALGLVRAMQGSFDEARALVTEDDEILLDLGLRQSSAAHSIARGEVETIARDLEAAERILRSGIARLEELGDLYTRTNASWRLAVVLCELGQDEEADQWATVAAEAPPTGIYVDIWWRLVRAIVRARRGEADEAQALLVEALELSSCLGERGIHADISMAAAEAYGLVGQNDDAERMLREAVAVAERKEYWSALARAQALLSGR
jgi:DNA-binding SARP family transcriptional activator